MIVLMNEIGGRVVEWTAEDEMWYVCVVRKVVQSGGVISNLSYGRN